MKEATVTNLLQKVGESLNRISSESYSEVFERLENSIDFIADGELKRLIGLRFQVSNDVSIVLSAEPYRRDGMLLGINVNLGIISSLLDFTSSSISAVNKYPVRFAGKFRFDGLNSHYWAMKVSNLHREVRSSAHNLEREYTPSNRLEKIVGPGPMTKLKILDSVSSYIIKNNLRLNNGHIKIDGLLKPFYSKNTVTVCEWTFFDTLRENTLISEFQLQQYLALRGHQRFSKKIYLKRKVIPIRVSGASEYIDGSIT